MAVVFNVKKYLGPVLVASAMLAAPSLVFAAAEDPGTKNHTATCITADNKTSEEPSQQPKPEKKKAQSTKPAQSSEAKKAEDKKTTESKAAEESSYSFSFLHYLFNKFDMDNLIGTDLLQDAVSNAVTSFWE